MILMHLPLPKKGANPQEESFGPRGLIQSGSVGSNVDKNERKSTYSVKTVSKISKPVMMGENFRRTLPPMPTQIVHS